MEKGMTYLYDLNGKEGWLLTRQHIGFDYSPVLQLRRSNFTSPWRDPVLHYHTTAYELFLVFHGELWLVIEDLPIRLTEENLLLVPPGVPHSVVGGKESIQHYVMQIDTQRNDETKKMKIISPEYREDQKGLFHERNKELDVSKGFFADLKEPENHNCWLIGTRNKYVSQDFCFAYIISNAEADESKNGHRKTLHYHTKATEWYWTFEGDQELEVDGKDIRVSEGYLMRIGNNVPHNINWRKYPFRGLTMRTSLFSDEKVEV